MTDLVVRRLLIDLKPPIAARWNGGDAFRSAFFNALSMSFPAGEQYFIDSVRAGLKALPAERQQVLAQEVQGFIGQEATHRRVHGLFNEHLQKQGFDNWIERHAARRLAAHTGDDLRNKVAATAATEHFTALFADWMLRHPEALEGAEARLRTLWLWHSAEESEHRNTAFDMYQALGGNHQWRVRVFRYITVTFLSDLLRQTLRNLWHDGSLWRWSTWRSAARLLFARDGMIRSNVGLWRDYMAPDFHPSQHPAELSQQWLRDNTAQFAVVGQAA
jgi:predicted metal-dependent hydrolase